MRSKAYRSINVKDVDIETFARQEPSSCLAVGLDIGKHDIFCVLRWTTQHFERPWRVRNPSQLRLLALHLKRLAEVHQLRIALEPTGTYGDPLRQTLNRQGLKVHRVSPKMASDYAEIFDGVPSQHDGKDAAIIAELAALDRCWLWEFPQASEWQQELAYWVNWLDAQRCQQTPWLGRLEAEMARHWPEATGLVPLSRTTLLEALVKYGGPRALAQANDEAEADLQRWSRKKLSPQKCQALLRSAAESVGVDQGDWDIKRMQAYAQEALNCRHQLLQARRRVKQLATQEPSLVAQGKVAGATTASVLWVHLGAPRQYQSGSAYRKAMGLNLAERSSGTHQGQLRLSKRGQSQVRRWLYFSALRWLKDKRLSRWYREKKNQHQRPGRVLVVALMRKLALALYNVGARGEAFEVDRLVPRERELAGEES